MRGEIGVGMSLVNINDVLKITTRVEKIHPYKVVGDRDSYSPYNEGWSDCVSLIEGYLEKLPSAEPEERTAKVEHVDLNNTQHLVYKCLECGQYFHKTSWGRPMNYCPYCGARLEWE